MPLPHWASAIRERRRELGKSQNRIVGESEGRLNQTELSRLERGLIHPTLDLSTAKLYALLEALEWSPSDFAEATRLEYPGLPAQVSEQMRRIEVQPEWQAFAVYGSVSAGAGESEPLEGESIAIPAEILRRKGVKPQNVRVYLVNGDCMISEGASRQEKSIAPGDYIAVDRGRRAVSGDIVVAWWPREEKLVVKRYKVEKEGIRLYPTQPAHPVLVLGLEEDLYIIGPVFWRGGGI